ncbi:hypothetical protein DFJ74DRAFT_714088 [Hyaloraphidium curvatum]|nr:hypothetical protein DFJ74DRAFT_714088 [Hyaloraphidium curvatum]
MGTPAAMRALRVLTIALGVLAAALPAAAAARTTRRGPRPSPDLTLPNNFRPSSPRIELSDPKYVAKYDLPLDVPQTDYWAELRDPARRLQQRQAQPTFQWFNWTMREPLPPNAKQKTYKLYSWNWGADNGGDVTWNVQNMLDRCHEIATGNLGPCEVIFTAGKTYQLTHLKFGWALHDFTIVGNGALLLFTRASIDAGPFSEDGLALPFFDINNCYRCRFLNFQVDWDWNRWRIASLTRFVSQSISGNKTSWTFTFISPPTPGGVVDSDTIFAYQSVHPVDPQFLTIGVRGRYEFYLVPEVQENRRRLGKRQQRNGEPLIGAPKGSMLRFHAGDFPDAKMLSVQNLTVADGGLSANAMIGPTFTISFDNQKNNFGSGSPVPGELYMIKHLTYEVHGFRLRLCVNCILRDVFVRSVPGKAVWVGSGSKQVWIDRLRVDVPVPVGLTSPRPMSGAADGVWSTLTQGSIMVKDSTFAYQGDDAVNFHQTTVFSPITVSPDRRTLTITNMPLWRYQIKPGDRLEFFHKDNLQTTGVRRGVLSAQQVAPDTWTIVLDSGLPSTGVFASNPIDAGLASSAFDDRNVVAKRIRTYGHRARGALLNVPRNALAEYSTFSRVQMAAVLIGPSVQIEEGTAITDTVVGGNEAAQADINANHATYFVRARNAAGDFITVQGLLNRVNVTQSRADRCRSPHTKAVAATNLGFWSNRATQDATSLPFYPDLAGRFVPEYTSTSLWNWNRICFANCGSESNYVPINQPRP